MVNLRKRVAVLYRHEDDLARLVSDRNGQLVRAVGQTRVAVLDVPPAVYMARRGARPRLGSNRS